MHIVNNSSGDTNTLMASCSMLENTQICTQMYNCIMLFDGIRTYIIAPREVCR